jgi:hypothetical protein
LATGDVRVRDGGGGVAEGGGGPGHSPPHHLPSRLMTPPPHPPNTHPSQLVTNSPPAPVDPSMFSLRSMLSPWRDSSDSTSSVVDIDIEERQDDLGGLDGMDVGPIERQVPTGLPTAGGLKMAQERAMMKDARDGGGPSVPAGSASKRAWVGDVGRQAKRRREENGRTRSSVGGTTGVSPAFGGGRSAGAGTESSAGTPQTRDPVMAGLFTEGTARDLFRSWVASVPCLVHHATAR